MSRRNPTAVDVGSAIQQDLQERMRTVMPATVLAYHTTGPRAQTIDAQPSANFDGKPHAQVNDIPVLFPGGGGWSMEWDLLPGDLVVLFVADRELDGARDGNWQPYTPGDARMHSHNDALAMPCAPVPIPGLSRNFTIRGTNGIHLEINGETGNLLLEGTVQIQAGVNATMPTGLLAQAQPLHQYLTTIIGAAATATMDGGATFKANLLAQLAANPYTQFATTKTFAE